MQYKLNIAQQTWDIDKLYELEKHCSTRLMEKKQMQTTTKQIEQLEMIAR
jgi:hypothetical protein